MPEVFRPTWRFGYRPLDFEPTKPTKFEVGEDSLESTGIPFVNSVSTGISTKSDKTDAIQVVGTPSGNNVGSLSDFVGTVKPTKLAPESAPFERESTSAAPKKHIASVSSGRFLRWNAADLVRQAQRWGIRLFLDGSHLRVDVSDAREIPDDLLNAITAKAGVVISFLHRAEAQADLEQRFGPPLRRGRLCRACLTIDLTCQTAKGEWCDDCLLNLARSSVAAAVAQGMIGGTT